MKKFLLFLLLFVNLHIVMTVSAQQKGVELREVMIIAPKVACECCHDSINSLYEYITVHQPICPKWPDRCQYCGLSMERCQLEDHYSVCPVLNRDSGGESGSSSGGSGGGGGGGVNSGSTSATGVPGSSTSDNGTTDYVTLPSKRACDGVFVPKEGEHVLSNVTIPTKFPIQIWMDCSTLAMTFPLCISNPILSEDEFWNIKFAYDKEFYDRYKYQIYNGSDNGVKPGMYGYQADEMLPEAGFEKIDKSLITASIESGCAVWAGVQTGYTDDKGAWHYFEDHDDSYPKIEGHAVLIVGYTDLQQYICMDPGFGEIKYYNAREFERTGDHYYPAYKYDFYQNAMNNIIHNACEQTISSLNNYQFPINRFYR